jgi:Polysaccharide lyase
MKLAIVLLSLLSASVLAESAMLSLDFEDGQMPSGHQTQMAVPPKLVTEGDNTFLRITGSPSDKESIPSGYPDRNRSTVEFTSPAPNMPLLNDSNERQTYSAKIRFKDNSGTDGVVLELFQDGPAASAAYGSRDGKGPVVICWRTDGHVWCRANYANETKWDTVDLGYIPAGSWHTYRVKAVWSHDPSEGRIEISLDGVLKRKITGRDVNLGSTSNRLPSLKLGLYGDDAVGVIDVDEVTITEGGGSGSLPSPPLLPPPTNLRVVGQ